MSKTQDVFGAAPKSVLNKPMMHVQDVQPEDVSGQVFIVGENQRNLNTVVINEIGGASLGANAVNLPAGEYYIEAEVNHFSLNTARTDGMKAAIQIDGVDALLSNSCTINYINAFDTKVAGKVVLSQAAVLTVVSHVRATSIGGGSPNDVTGKSEKYVDLRIWKLDSNIETPVVSDPTMTLVRPLFHAQEQKPLNTEGDASVSGANDRNLNTVITNEIIGASLASKEVTLPAGTYYVEAETQLYAAAHCDTFIRDSDDNILLSATAMFNLHSGSLQGGVGLVSGRITLTETTAIKVTNNILNANSTGLGRKGKGDLGTHETYSDLRIWQLDAVNKQPVLVNDKLYPLPGNVIVTGNMHGLEYEYTAPNEITVQAGICMDSVNETVLTLTNPQLVTIPSGVNTVYNLFLTDDGQLVKTDTDVDGANLPAQDKRRWIGFVVTGAGGSIKNFLMSADAMYCAVRTDWIIGYATTAFVQYPLSPFCPPSRVREILIHGDPTTNNYLHVSIDGINTYQDQYQVAAVSRGPVGSVPAVPTPWIKGNQGFDISIGSFKMKR